MLQQLVRREAERLVPSAACVAVRQRDAAAARALFA
jgi:hypothetical protein